jgi:CubicO group peptidase (beta-lactamase class C family)
MQTGYSSNRGELFPSGVSYGHTGFTGTSVWIDPKSQSAVIILSNRVHPNGKGNVNKLRRQIATLAAAAILKTKIEQSRSANFGLANRIIAESSNDSLFRADHERSTYPQPFAVPARRHPGQGPL